MWHFDETPEPNRKLLLAIKEEYEHLKGRKFYYEEGYYDGFEYVVENGSYREVYGWRYEDEV